MASLTKYTPILGKRLAAHLLRRATYHITPAKIEAFALLTAEQAVEKLCQASTLQLPDGPRSWENDKPMFNLTNLGMGEFFEFAKLNVQLSPVTMTTVWRHTEAVQDPTIRWKVVDWLHTLFVTSSEDSSLTYPYWRLLYAMSFGDIRTLAKKMTVDNLMLNFLNNENNEVGAPNENYAREFLELFTILKGPVKGIGDYTNYTEADISLAARVLTGFKRNNTQVDTDTGIVRGAPSFSKHDKGDKTFGAAFQNTTIKGATSANDMFRELSDFINMIFVQDETARAFVRRMYLFFVSDIISPEVETDIIRPLAATLKANNYNHIIVLKQLLKSQHFYDADDANKTNEIIGGKIKSPNELLRQSLTLLNVTNKSTDKKQLYYNDYTSIYAHTAPIGLHPRGPATVEGYAGYYKGPEFSKNWFLSNFLYQRLSFGKSFLRGKTFNTNNYFPYQVDVVKWVNANIDLPTSPGTPTAPIGAADAKRVVDFMLDYFLPERPTGDRYNYFMSGFLDGLSPINWYFEWKEYLDTKDTSDIKVPLERLLNSIFASLEFQTF
jgi:uncharacterized protein (DUF1800 family)